MNLSASGSDKNNENTVVYRGAGIASVFAQYIQAEAALLRRRAIRRRMEDVCHEEPIAARCDAIQALIERGEGDADRGAALADGLERCRALATAWGERCATWEADPEGWVAAEMGSMRESGLYDNPKSLRDCACNDHIDNDRDGLVDQQHPACGENICFDGDDGDGDGLIDAVDPDCDVFPEAMPETSTP